MIKKPFQFSSKSESSHLLVSFYKNLVALKSLYRQGWIKHHDVSESEAESVADHIYATSMMSYVAAREYFPELDADRVLRIALFHDLGESIVGEFTIHEVIDRVEKDALELQAIKQIFQNFTHADEFAGYWQEFHDASTPEAKFVRLVGKLEAAMMAKVYEQSGNFAGFEEFMSQVDKLSDIPEEVKTIIIELREM